MWGWGNDLAVMLSLGVFAEDQSLHPNMDTAAHNCL